MVITLSKIPKAKSDGDWKDIFNAAIACVWYVIHSNFTNKAKAQPTDFPP